MKKAVPLLAERPFFMFANTLVVYYSIYSKHL